MNHYTSSFEIQLRARSDPTDPWTVHYSRTVTGDFGPETLEVDITPDIGPATQVQLRFFGYYWNLDYWYVDDVELFSFQAYIMSGQGMGSTEVTIQNALPGVVAPAGFVDTVNEKVTIAFEGFELTDAAIQERTEEFWYKVPSATEQHGPLTVHGSTREPLLHRTSRYWSCTPSEHSRTQSQEFRPSSQQWALDRT
jgi:hypothetical protein